MQTAILLGTPFQPCHFLAVETVASWELGSLSLHPRGSLTEMQEGLAASLHPGCASSLGRKRTGWPSHSRGRESREQGLLGICWESPAILAGEAFRGDGFRDGHACVLFAFSGGFPYAMRDMTHRKDGLSGSGSGGGLSGAPALAESQVATLVLSVGLCSGSR